VERGIVSAELQRDAIDRVGIVGCGVMGAGIAETCARAGIDTLVAVSSDASRWAGQARITRSLDHGLRTGRLTEEVRHAALDRIQFTTDLGDLGDRQLVVEAIRENEPEKAQVFATLDKILEDPDALLASNTSAIPITRLARVTDRPAHVIGLHFFSPAPVMPLVEVVSSFLTGQRTRERAEAFLTEVLGKQVIHSPDRAGFLVNALLIPYLLAAMRMVESGFAPAEVVDKGMVLGCAHPMGPLKLADVIGLDVVAAVATALYDEFKEPLYAPPPLLLRMIDGGRLGKKSGHGFHRYA
jgi:3-hydroxybutyryl-CoA dehydrogenase